jgi:hypothetical protein
MTHSLFLVLLVVSLIVAAAGNVLGLVTAFQESIVLGILCFLFPIALLVFYAMKWKRPAVRLAFRLSIFGLLGLLLSSLGLGYSSGASLDLDQLAIDDAMEADQTELATAPESEALPAIVATPIPPSESPCEYEQCMNIGYAATKQKDYGTALINFRRALGHRPNDPFATKAIHNLEVAMGTAPILEPTEE